MNANADPAQDPIVVRLRDLPVEETFAVYLDLSESSPEKADVAALALREQGRLGRFDESYVGALATAIAIAPSSLCAGHLAKALATLGRAAGPAGPLLMDRMGSMLVTTDVEYWSFDGCIWALGYLGGPEVPSFLDALEREEPNRAVRSESIYVGRMPKDARERQFGLSLTGARDLLEKDDPGVWRTRKTTLPLGRPPRDASKTAGKAWNVRSASQVPKRQGPPRGE